MAPEHRRLNRYGTMDLQEICALPVASAMDTTAHCYMWVPNALLSRRPCRAQGVGLRIQVQHRLAQAAQGRRQRRPRSGLLLPERDRAWCYSACVGRTRAPRSRAGRRSTILAPASASTAANLTSSTTSWSSARPVRTSSLFARGTRPGWTGWGNQAEQYEIAWDTYANHSQAPEKPPRAAREARAPRLIAAE